MFIMVESLDVNPNVIFFRLVSSFLLPIKVPRLNRERQKHNKRLKICLSLLCCRKYDGCIYSPNLSFFLVSFFSYPTLTIVSFKQEKSIDSSKQVKLGFLTGLVPREKSMVFERILFRATRGNVYIRQTVVEEPVIDPNSGEKVRCFCFSFKFSQT